ncbi:hypothetical protein JKP88DRAFT_277002 [Tribonema minus]|uniref:Uncharacterized protein n=1 Tax=Tribonema minus TaxID=303371 RepID=A0A836CGG6_9STRA|nr:hypothetical protein JKP88DRAFT_277002 [Tribonema minus]
MPSIAQFIIALQSDEGPRDEATLVERVGQLNDGQLRLFAQFCESEVTVKHNDMLAASFKQLLAAARAEMDKRKEEAHRLEPGHRQLEEGEEVDEELRKFHAFLKDKAAAQARVEAQAATLRNAHAARLQEPAAYARAQRRRRRCGAASLIAFATMVTISALPAAPHALRVTLALLSAAAAAVCAAAAHRADGAAAAAAAAAAREPAAAAAAAADPAARRRWVKARRRQLLRDMEAGIARAYADFEARFRSEETAAQRARKAQRRQQAAAAAAAAATAAKRGSGGGARVAPAAEPGGTLAVAVTIANWITTAFFLPIALRAQLAGRQLELRFTSLAAFVTMITVSTLPAASHALRVTLTLLSAAAATICAAAAYRVNGGPAAAAAAAGPQRRQRRRRTQWRGGEETAAERARKPEARRWQQAAAAAAAAAGGGGSGGGSEEGKRRRRWRRTCHAGSEAGGDVSPATTLQ